jgi:hypothetical protein
MDATFDIARNVLAAVGALFVVCCLFVGALIVHARRRHEPDFDDHVTEALAIPREERSAR